MNPNITLDAIQEKFGLSDLQAKRLKEAWEQRLEKLLEEQRAAENRRAIDAEREVGKLLAQGLRRSVNKVRLFPGMTEEQILCLKYGIENQRTAPAWLDANRNWRWMGQAMPDGSRRKYDPPPPTDEFIENFMLVESRERAQQVRRRARTAPAVTKPESLRKQRVRLELAPNERKVD